MRIICTNRNTCASCCYLVQRSQHEPEHHRIETRPRRHRHAAVASVALRPDRTCAARRRTRPDPRHRDARARSRATAPVALRADPRRRAHRAGRRPDRAGRRPRAAAFAGRSRGTRQRRAGRAADHRGGRGDPRRRGHPRSRTDPVDRRGHHEPAERLPRARLRRVLDHRRRRLRPEAAARARFRADRPPARLPDGRHAGLAGRAAAAPACAACPARHHNNRRVPNRGRAKQAGSACRYGTPGTDGIAFSCRRFAIDITGSGPHVARRGRCAAAGPGHQATDWTAWFFQFRQRGAQQPADPAGRGAQAGRRWPRPAWPRHWRWRDAPRRIRTRRRRPPRPFQAFQAFQASRPAAARC